MPIPESFFPVLSSPFFSWCALNTSRLIALFKVNTIVEAHCCFISLYLIKTNDFILGQYCENKYS